MDRALAHGEVLAVLPGIYARTEDSARLVVRARAARLADPQAVIGGESAARAIPPRLQRRLAGVVTTSRALTALDLVDTYGGEALDHALRRGVEPAELRFALRLTAGRRGNRLRRLLLEESRDGAYSAAERAAHRALRSAGVGGWVANEPIFDESGDLVACGHLMVDELRLCFELDGGSYHLDPGAVLRDRARDERLAGLGWMVVRVPARRTLQQPAAFVDSFRRTVAARRALQEGRSGARMASRFKTARIAAS